MSKYYRAGGEMVDALASGASVRKDVGVRVPLRPREAAYRVPICPMMRQFFQVGVLYL